jgi:hypothetical protein
MLALGPYPPPQPSSLGEGGGGFALPLPPRGRGIKGDGGPAANRTAMRRPVLRGRTFAASYQRGSDPKRLDGEWYSAHPPPRPSSPGDGGDGSPSPYRPAGGGSRGRAERHRLRRRRATDRPAIPRRRRDDRRPVKRPANAGEAPPWGSCGPASPDTRSGGGLTPGQHPPPPPLPPPARGRGIKGEGGAPAPQARPRGQPAFIAPSTQGAEQRARRLAGAAEALPYASSGRGWQTARQRPACLRRGARIALHPDPTPSERGGNFPRPAALREGARGGWRTCGPGCQRCGSLSSGDRIHIRISLGRTLRPELVSDERVGTLHPNPPPSEREEGIALPLPPCGRGIKGEGVVRCSRSSLGGAAFESGALRVRESLSPCLGEGLSTHRRRGSPACGDPGTRRAPIRRPP